MDYQSIVQTLQAASKRLDVAATVRALNDNQKRILKQQKADLNDAVSLVKRVKMYGGIESLLQQAAKGTANETLFPVDNVNKD